MNSNKMFHGQQAHENSSLNSIKTRLRTSSKVTPVYSLRPPISVLSLATNWSSSESNSMLQISSTREDVKEAFKLSAEGKISAMVHRKVHLDDVNGAFSEMKSKMSLGRIMIEL